MEDVQSVPQGCSVATCCSPLHHDPCAFSVPLIAPNAQCLSAGELPVGLSCAVCSFASFCEWVTSETLMKPPFLLPQVASPQTAHTSPRTQAPTQPRDPATHHTAALLPLPHALPLPSVMLHQVCRLLLGATCCTLSCRGKLSNLASG